MSGLPAARERAMLWTLAGIQFTHILDFMIMMPLGPQFMRLFGISATQFGLLVSSYTYAAGTMALLAALFIDRFERRRALLVLYGLFGAATLACAAAPNYVALVCARAAAGAFGGMLGALIFTIVGDTVPEQRRGRAMGLVMAAFSASAVAGVPLGLAIAAAAGWRWTFVFVAAVSTAFLLAGLRTLPVLDAHVAQARGHPLRELWNVLKDTNHQRAFAFVVLLTFGGFTVIPFLGVAYVANVGLSESQLAYVYLAGGAATMLSARTIGWLADRYGKRKVFRIVAVLSLLPILGITHAPALSLAAAIGLGVVFMMLVSGRFIPAMALITSSAALGKRGTFMSLNSAVMQVAAGTAALIAGALATRLPPEQGGQLVGFDHVGYFAVACTLVAIAAVGWIQIRSGPADASKLAVAVQPVSKTPSVRQ